MVKEIKLNDENKDILIELSRQWVLEDISYGIIEDNIDDLKDKRIFVYELDNKYVGCILAHETLCKDFNIGSVISDDTEVLVIDSFYVLKEYRSQGIGKELFKYVEELFNKDIVLTTSTKDYEKIFNFYINEVGMDFHSALFFKKR